MWWERDTVKAIYILAESSYVYKNNKPCCQLINMRITHDPKKTNKKHGLRCFVNFNRAFQTLFCIMQSNFLIKQLKNIFLNIVL